MNPEAKDSVPLNDEADESIGTKDRCRKPLSFYIAFLCLFIMVFPCSMDSTIMAVSIPVSQPQLRCSKIVTKANQRRSSPKNWAVLPFRPSGRTSPSPLPSSSACPYTPAHRMS